jgi:hypothetical protein
VPIELEVGEDSRLGRHWQVCTLAGIVFWGGSSHGFNDGTTQTERDPPLKGGPVRTHAQAQCAQQAGTSAAARGS